MRCSPAARICRARLSGSPGWARSLLLQSAVEAEVAAFLGRDRYERAASCGDPHPGMRNGYCPTTVKTTAGPVTLARPKLRGTTERFASQLFGKHVTKTNALESLVIAGFVRGLSTRDVEAALVEALGERGGGVEVDGVADLRRDQDPVRGVERPPPRRR